MNNIQLKLDVQDTCNCRHNSNTSVGWKLTKIGIGVAVFLILVSLSHECESLRNDIDSLRQEITTISK